MASELQLIEFLSEITKDINWNYQANSNKFVSPLIYNKDQGLKLVEALRGRLGNQLKVSLKKLETGIWRLEIKKDSLEKEYIAKQEKVDELKRRTEAKRSYSETEKRQVVRVPQIDRNLSAQNLLLNNPFFLSPKQINYIRRLQLEHAQFEQSLKRKIQPQQMLIGYENCDIPNLFSENDPHVLLGEKGEAIIMPRDASLGSGAAGEAFVGQSLDTGDFCVVKHFHSPKDSETKERFEKENAALSDLNLLIDKVKVITGRSPDLYNIQEIAWGHNIANYLGLDVTVRVPISLEERLDIFIKSLEAINRIHQQDKMLHKDIKADNIMWDKDKQTATLVDVGFAAKMDEEGKQTDPVLAGTPHYLAPELYADESLGRPKVYNIQTEMYAAGMLGCEMFSQDDLTLRPHEIRDNFYWFREPEASLSERLSNSDIFQNSPLRTSAEQALYDQLAKMVHMDPKHREKSFTDVIENLKSIRSRLDNIPLNQSANLFQPKVVQHRLSSSEPIKQETIGEELFQQALDDVSQELKVVQDRLSSSSSTLSQDEEDEAMSKLEELYYSVEATVEKELDPEQTLMDYARSIIDSRLNAEMNRDTSPELREIYKYLAGQLSQSLSTIIQDVTPLEKQKLQETPPPHAINPRITVQFKNVQQKGKGAEGQSMIKFLKEIEKNVDWKDDPQTKMIVSAPLLNPGQGLRLINALRDRLGGQVDISIKKDTQGKFHLHVNGEQLENTVKQQKPVQKPKLK